MKPATADRTTDSVSADTPPTPALALALHDMALAADQEGRRYRTARNREVAELYAAGMSGGEIGRVLGVGRRAVHNMIADAKDEA